MACYWHSCEHKVFAQGVVCNINSLGQSGVELGKELAGRVQRDLSHGLNVESHDPSTTGLIKRYMKVFKPDS